MIIFHFFFIYSYHNHYSRVFVFSSDFFLEGLGKFKSHCLLKKKEEAKITYLVKLSVSWTTEAIYWIVRLNISVWKHVFIWLFPCFQPVPWIAMECVVTRHVHCVKTSVSVTPKMAPVFVPRDSLVLYVTKVSPSILIFMIVTLLFMYSLSTLLLS